jgi:hypothetical protein
MHSTARSLYRFALVSGSTMCIYPRRISRRLYHAAAVLSVTTAAPANSRCDGALGGSRPLAFHSRTCCGCACVCSLVRRQGDIQCPEENDQRKVPEKNGHDDFSHQNGSSPGSHCDAATTNKLISAIKGSPIGTHERTNLREASNRVRHQSPDLRGLSEVATR